jgi:phosphomannomutase
MIVTASHNPADHNGLKMMIGALPPTPEDFHQLRARLEKGGFRQHQGGAEIIDPVPTYKAHVLERWKHLRHPGGLAVVLDAGNGAWSDLASALFATLGFHVHPLFCKIDGTFPNRSPDCSRPINLGDLRSEVLRTGVQFGVAWDGDGDRVAFVDDAGSVVTTDEVSALMVREMVPREPGAKVIYDLKLSELVPHAVTDCLGVPVMERSGYAFIKRAMIGHNALLGCEASGHYFFRELYGGDDGLFASLLMAELLTSHGLPLSKLRQTLPPFFITPDLRIPAGLVSYGEIVERLYSNFPGAKGTKLDGIRLETKQGIVLVRKSVTEPVVTMRLEGRTEDSFRELLDVVLNSLPKAAGEITKQIDQSAEVLW